jgi:hypothetical protein
LTLVTGVRARTNRPWLPEEDGIIDRHLRLLAKGRYPDVTAAARVCARDIKRLYASIRKTDPHHFIASRERPFGSLRRRMSARLKALGLPWTNLHLTSPEERVVGRYVRGLKQGRYHDAYEAAKACVEELAQVSRAAGRARPLPLRKVWERLYHRARRSDYSWGYRRWKPEDAAVAERYARAAADGEYATTQLAAETCAKELARIHCCRTWNKPFRAVFAMVHALRRRMGPLQYPRWQDAEERVCRSYIRLLFEGRYEDVDDAAVACTAALARLRGNPKKRALSAVLIRLGHGVSKLRLPRYKGQSTPEELRLYDEYARKVARGDYATALEAASACRREMGRVYARGRIQKSIGGTKLALRPIRGVYMGILFAATRQGLQFPKRLWMPAEERIFESWLRWYCRHRPVRRLQPLAQASAGLNEDLAKSGFRRSVRSCRKRLVEARHNLEESGGHGK